MLATETQNVDVIAALEEVKQQFISRNPKSHIPLSAVPAPDFRPHPRRHDRACRRMARRERLSRRVSHVRRRRHSAVPAR